MDPIKDIQSAALCIIGLCSKVRGSRCSISDGIYHISSYAEGIDDRLKDINKIIRELRQKNEVLSKKNCSLSKEIAEKQQSLQKTEDDLQSSQLSLSALCGDSDDDGSLSGAAGIDEEKGETSQSLFSDLEDEKQTDFKTA